MIMKQLWHDKQVGKVAVTRRNGCSRATLSANLALSCEADDDAPR